MFVEDSSRAEEVLKRSTCIRDAVGTSFKYLYSRHDMYSFKYLYSNEGRGVVVKKPGTKKS
jgi:hypothetical protein